MSASFVLPSYKGVWLDIRGTGLSLILLATLTNNIKR